MKAVRQAVMLCRGRHSHESEGESQMLKLAEPASIEAKRLVKRQLAPTHVAVGPHGETWHIWQIDRRAELLFRKRQDLSTTNRSFSSAHVIP